MSNKYKIISVGGSIIIPPTGFNIEFLKKFRSIITNRVKKGDKFVLVVGGGSTCRKYQQAAKSVANLSDKQMDWLGIYTTWYNAEFTRLLFGDLAYKEIVKNPTNKPITDKSIIIAGGWKPGRSTDFDAVLLAKTYGAKEVVNASNIDYVYSADPKKYKNAKSLEKLTWKEFRKIIGDKWTPGANLPFDPLAAKEAEKFGLTVKFVKGTELKEVEKCLDGEQINGTVVWRG